MPQKLGQHFLKNSRALQKITAALEIKPSDVIVEIGAGHGELTRHLLKAGPGKIIAIEKDERLIAVLKNLLKSLESNPPLSSPSRYSVAKEIEGTQKASKTNGKIGKRGQGRAPSRLSEANLTSPPPTATRLEIVSGDVLAILPQLSRQLKNKKWKLAGNIPYYLTGYLLRQIGELEKKPSLVVLTVQREVAERTCAKPPRMNLLAASVQFWGKPKIAGFISKKSFQPQPKVDSAILKITPSSEPRYSVSRGMEGEKGKKAANKRGANKRLGGGEAATSYYRFIKILFAQPRKTVLNNLAQGLGRPKDQIQTALSAAKINPHWRPQDLEVAKIRKIIRAFWGSNSYNKTN